MPPEITFSKEALIDFALPVFDWHVDEEGYIRQADGQYAPAYKRKRVHKDNVGGIANTDDGPMLVRDHFCDIVDACEDGIL